MIKFENLTKSYGDNTVLSRVSGHVESGKIIVLLGPSGSGKSTLLRCMNLLETPNAGTVSIDGQVITETSTRLTDVRKNIGMVFQHFHLFPHMTVLENVKFAQIQVLGRKAQDAEIVARDLLQKVGLADKAGAYPGRLSGGQKQRVAIARSLAMNPKVMLFDEPTSALDPEMVQEVLDVIQSLGGQSKGKDSMTMMIVTHEMHFAKDIADEIWFLDEGQIIERADPKTFFSNPKTDRAKAFLSKIRV